MCSKPLGRTRPANPRSTIKPKSTSHARKREPRPAIRYRMGTFSGGSTSWSSMRPLHPRPTAPADQQHVDQEQEAEDSGNRELETASQERLRDAGDPSLQDRRHG